MSHDDKKNSQPRGSQEGDPTRISRRRALRTATVAGGVAWATPTIQALGQGSAFAAEAGSPGGPCVGSGKAKKGVKPVSLVLRWLGDSCTSFPGTEKSTCTPNPGGACAAGQVWVSCAQATLSASTFTAPFEFTVTNFAASNDLVLVVRTGSAAGPICQTVKLHVSCSDPDLAPGVQVGGFLLVSWA